MVLLWVILTDPSETQNTHGAVGQLISTQPQSSPRAPATTDTEDVMKYVLDC